MEYNLFHTKNTEKNILKFLEESNAIEDEYGSEPLEQAKLAWDYIIEAHELTSSNIRQTHKLLMIGRPIYDYERGYWRERDVYIGGRKGKNPILISELMTQWAETANKPKTVEQVIEDHIRYEHIHPFIDGNGRTGRIFLNWQLIKNKHGPIIIWADDKFEDYYPWFWSTPFAKFA